jgi:hypothetical protein
MKIIPLLCCALVITACDGKDINTSNSGRVEALVQASSTATTVNGAITSNVFASIWDGTRWMDLGSPNGITIPLQLTTRATTVHGEQSVPTGDYERVRLVFRDATVRIAAGSTIGGGTVSSETTLEFGGTDGRVELVVNGESFEVERDATVRWAIVFDLRSQQWLTPSALQAGRVEDAALQAAVRVTTRREPR